MTTRWTPISAIAAKRNRLYGVGGWLLVFAISLFLNLLRELGSISSEARQAGMTLGELLSINHPGITFIKFHSIALVSLVAIVYWMMVMKATMFRPLTTWMLLSFTPIMTLIGIGNSFYDLDSALQSLIAWTISCAVWVTYLNRSRRVRVTFESLVREDEEQVHGTLMSTIEVPHARASTGTTSANLGSHLPAAASSPPNESSADITSEQLSAEKEMMPDSETKKEVDEDAIYKRIGEELQSGDRELAAWTRAYAESSGDEARTRARYIQLRARRLAQEHEETRQRQDAEEHARAEAQRSQQLVALRERLRRGDLAQEIEALRKKDEEVAALFYRIEYGVNLDHVKQQIRENPAYLGLIDRKGNSPLHAAIEARHESLAVFMLENGADPDVKNGAGVTARELARDIGMSSIDWKDENADVPKVLRTVSHFGTLDN